MSKDSKTLASQKEASKREEIMEMKSKGLNYKDKTGSTALIKACEGGFTELALQLIREGADLNARDNSGRTPLSIALDSGNYDLARSLIDYGANVTVYINSARLPAQFLKENPQLVNQLGANGMDGSFALSHDIPIFASDKLALEAVKNYIEGGGNVNITNTQKQTFLMMAADTDQIETARYLVEKGADLNMQDHEGNTALMYTAKKGSLDVAELLLENNADIDMQNNDEKTALMISVEEKHLEITKKLIEYNADITKKDKAGQNALMYAAKNGSLEVAKIMIEECCERKTKKESKIDDDARAKMEKLEKLDVESKMSKLDKLDATSKMEKLERLAAIKAATEEGSKKEEKPKVDLDNFINEQDEEGRTALMHTYENKHYEVFKYLVDQNADLFVKDKSGKSVVDKIHQEEDAMFKAFLKVSTPELDSLDVRIQNVREAKNKTQKQTDTSASENEAPITPQNNNKQTIKFNSQEYASKHLRV